MMSRKLILTILILSFSFLDLLVVRHEQINTVNEMMQLHDAIDQGNEVINSLSIEIETACSPSQLQQTFVTLEGFDESE
jgi:hypothetical protein